MTGMEVKVEGVRSAVSRLERIAAALDGAARSGVTQAVGIYAKEIRTNLRRRSHPLGTPTPSPPGEPPALVTGNLLRSVKQNRARRIQAHVYEGSTGPTAVYARIQEKGGRAGRGHRAHLPPRPYVHPALVAANPRAREVIRREISAALRTR